MVKIAPSILSADFAHLGRDIDRVSSADWLHMDVMDGLFVPNFSIGVPVIRSIRAYTETFLDVHLMIRDPRRYVKTFAQLGADQLSIHLESDGAEGLNAALDEMEALGVKKGVVVKPATPAEAVLPYLERGVDLVVVMTVEPGFGGQKLMTDQLPKISSIRQYIDKLCPTCRLEVDGGVNPDTAKLCVQAGANVLVAGSAIFGTPDPEGAIAALRASF